MKNVHPIITATSASPVDPDSSSSNEPTEPIIRLKLDKPLDWEWELTTSADTLPVIQLLDKEGRLLVETTGQTAQRARGSFREGLKTRQEFPSDKSWTVSTPSLSTSSSSTVPIPQRNRNVDGFSTKFAAGAFGYKPRKSRSEATVKEKEKKEKKRLSSGDSGITVKRVEDEEKRAASKKYSLGDYLRQQIIDDLTIRKKSTVGKTPEEIAEKRCKKMKAYLKSRSETLPRLLQDEENNDNSKVDFDENDVRDGRIEDSLIRLREAIEKEDSRSENEKLNRVRESDAIEDKSFGAVDENLKLEDGKNRREITNEELAKVRSFLREKIQRKMEQERSRNTSGNAWTAGSQAGIQKRYSDYRNSENAPSYRTRKVHSETNIVDTRILERDKQKRNQQQLERNASSFSSRTNGSCCSNSFQQKGYRRSRSETILEAEVEGNRRGRRNSQTRESTEKRKLYRKTKSDVLLGQMRSGLDTELENPSRRIRNQDNVEESWREYKERKKHEKLQQLDETEDDFMCKPRYKDICSSRNCRVCQNLENCVNVLQSDDASVNQGILQSEKCYLVDKKSDISMNRVLEKIGEKNQTKINNVIPPDYGYNTIPKKTLNDYKQLYTRSNVKKSDTFKIVDGSEELEESAKKDRSNRDVKAESGEGLDYSNCEDVLTNKSNEDIAKDYFRRVYQLLKKRQNEGRRIADNQGCEDSSSSNYAERVHKKRLRRKKKESTVQGEEVVTVSPAAAKAAPAANGGQDSWKVPRLSLSNESSSNRRKGCRIQAQPGSKRTRPAPPVPTTFSTKVNVKDEYLDWPNKENTPGNAVNATERVLEAEKERSNMGSNLSRHNGKGLNGRRTQSSGNLCDSKGKLNSMGKILVPCSSGQRESRYKFCGSLPNHLDDKDVLDNDSKENNNITMDGISGKFGGTLPHKKRSLGVHFSDGGPTGTLDLVKHRSQDSLDENDPWRYQQSDLDLVKTRHGNFDTVRRNRSVDSESGDSRRRYTRGTSVEGKSLGNSDLDLVGTLPKRKHDGRSDGDAPETNSSPSRPSAVDTTESNDLLMQIVHKPDCELVRHRQQLGKCIDLTLSKLTGGEPQDQGYASERSPEDEHPPPLPGQPFPNITPESTFRVTLQKSSRGLGLSVSGGGTAGPVRVKRLFPQQPAALSNKLQSGDILLAANGIPLTGLTNYEALEVLRTTPSTVELVVCRVPGEKNVSPPGAPPPPPARREPPTLNPLPLLQIEPCGEFDIEMTKVGGSLGFTLRKADSSALGHYVRALVREPALSDGRIRPGDKIVAVDGAPLSPMSHEEAVQLLRQCGPTVKLRLYRDLAQTPVAALSPTEPDHPLRPPRTSLRQEAVDMLCDLAVRKLSPGTSSGSSCKQSPGASCNSPRRLRRLATRTPNADSDQETLEKHPSVQTTSTSSQAAETSDSEQCSIRTQITNSQPNTPGTDIIDPPPLYDIYDSSDSSKIPARPSFLDLSAPQGKPHFQFCSLDSDLEYPATRDTVLVDDETRNRITKTSMLSSGEHDDNDLPSEPASMPPVLSSTSSTSTAFSYKNPAYQSANPACGAGTSVETAAISKTTHSSDQDIPGKILGVEDPGGSKGLLKWKGVMFAPDDGIDKTSNEGEKAGQATTDSAQPNRNVEQGTEVFMVELTRGWNSRLGFSLQPDGDRTVISVVHPDSVAAKDGRLKQGDVVMMVNDESVEHMSTADIIDLLRKIRGAIGITVMRRSRRETVT